MNNSKTTRTFPVSRSLRKRPAEKVLKPFKRAIAMRKAPQHHLRPLEHHLEPSSKPTPRRLRDAYLLSLTPTPQTKTSQWRCGVRRPPFSRSADLRRGKRGDESATEVHYQSFPTRPHHRGPDMTYSPARHSLICLTEVSAYFIQGSVVGVGGGDFNAQC